MIPVSMERWNAAFIAMPGHKGLYGPQGTGLLLCGREVEPLMFGGTGSASIRQEMPDFLPDRLEAGTQNVCGAAGLLAGMDFVVKRGVEKIGRHEQTLCRKMVERLERTPSIHVFSGVPQSGVLSFVAEGKDCESIGEQLSKNGIAARAGLHCAPFAHRTAGTLETGTVRLSFSVFNTSEQVVRAAEIIAKIASGGRARR
jgi:selenocysteine lyase/cysteine desulfurase